LKKGGTAMKRMENEKSKNRTAGGYLQIICLVLCLGMLLSFAGCGGEQTDEEVLQGFVKNMFTLPTDFAAEHREEIGIRDITAEYSAALRQELGEDLFAESYRDKFFDQVYPQWGVDLYCATADIQLVPQEVAIERYAEKSIVYAFTVQATAKTESEETPVTLEGKIQLDEDGKISYVEMDLATLDQVFALGNFGK
jgi:hypothetical protein